MSQHLAGPLANFFFKSLQGKKGKGGGGGGGGAGTAAGGTPQGTGSKGRRKSGASPGAASCSTAADAPGAGSCGAVAAAAAAVKPSEPVTQPVPAPVQPTKAKPKAGVASLLTESLAQAGFTVQASVSVDREPASPPVLTSGADRRRSGSSSGAGGIPACGSLGASDRDSGFSAGNGSGFGGFPYGTSPGAASYGSSPLGSSPGSGMEGGVPGRRARRALRRAAEDAAGAAGSVLPAAARLPPVPISWETAA